MVDRALNAGEGVARLAMVHDVKKELERDPCLREDQIDLADG